MSLFQPTRSRAPTSPRHSLAPLQKIISAMSHLCIDSMCDRPHNGRVRFGCLTAAARQSNPESLAGLCGLNRCAATVGLPSQGPAPLSTWGFSLGARRWTTATERHAQAGSRRLMGFSVMRSPDGGGSKARRRIASQPPMDRADRCPDAAAPGSREARQPARVSFASPLNRPPRSKS